MRATRCTGADQPLCTRSCPKTTVAISQISAAWRRGGLRNFSSPLPCACRYIFRYQSCRDSRSTPPKAPLDLGIDRHSTVCAGPVAGKGACASSRLPGSPEESRTEHTSGATFMIRSVLPGSSLQVWNLTPRGEASLKQIRTPPSRAEVQDQA